MGKKSAGFWLNSSTVQQTSRCCRLFNLNDWSLQDFKDASERRSDFRGNEMVFDIFRYVGTYFLFIKNSIIRTEFALFECTKLIDGKCSIYEDRPLLCKSYKFTESDGCNYTGCLTEPMCNGCMKSSDVKEWGSL